VAPASRIPGTEVSVTTRCYCDRGDAGFNYVRSDEGDYEANAIALKEWAVGTGYQQYFPWPNGALHADYRHFNDDWGVASHTLNLTWCQNLGNFTQLIHFLRFYSQGEADFFANIADTEQRYYADDYCLSSFGAVAVGLRLRHVIGNWVVNMAGGRYETDNSWGVYSGDESPALVEYWRYSHGLDHVFR